MANPGWGVGAKFVSVNLNKSYGQSSHHNREPFGGGSYGQAAIAGRARPGSGGSSGGSGGMVVLSRSRGSQKASGSKLSVPPPLNLPSLRKEHERFDLSGAGGGPTIAAGAGSGQRPTSSSMGWTKPVAVALPEKDDGDGDVLVETTGPGVAGETSRLGSAYMPPSARSAGIVAVNSSAASTRPLPKPVEKAVILRGEDFPSLQAALPVPSGPTQKQKDNANQKQKPATSEESTNQQQDGFVSKRVDNRPCGQDSSITSENDALERVCESRGLGNSLMFDQARTEDYFSVPLPLVRMNPRSDWADDERDTGHGIAGRSRDVGFSKAENYWDRDFDLPRTSVLPHKPAHNQYERWGLRGDETGRNFSSEVSKVDTYRQEFRTPSREGRERNIWRTSPLPKDGSNVQEVTNYRTGTGARTGFGKDIGSENKYFRPNVERPLQDNIVPASHETTYGRRNTGPFMDGAPQWNNIKEAYNGRGTEGNFRERYGAEQSYRYRMESSMSKSAFPSGGKMAPRSDPVMVSSMEKRGSAKTERQYFEDPYMSTSGFDDRDPFSGSLVGVIKRKKDAIKQSDLHDPVRESFEAELERVQKMQELERRRIIEEQERALEQAQREEEKRRRLIREEEERQQRLEEEAQEAAWRAEQERLEALRRAEVQKIAREEEKRRIVMEEERRKQAAKQKLMELEERMAKRQADGVKSDSSVVTANIDDKLIAILKNKDVSTNSELDTWEDSEQMQERITASSSFDSTVLSRPFENNTRSFATGEGSSGLLDRGKAFNSWRRDAFENGSAASSMMQEHEINHFSPRRDSFANVRAISRKEVYGGAGYMSSRTNIRGMQEPYLDDFAHLMEQRWNFSGDAEFQDNLTERYGDVGWAKNHFRGNTHSPYTDRPYPNSEAELYSYGRSQYSMRQPRVLPPPITSTQRNSYRAANERPGPSGFLVDDEHHSHAERGESTWQTGYYTGNQGGLEQSELVNMAKEDQTVGDEKLNTDMTPRCDSQSSVSVSSPPSTPPHLSHDELDESGESPMISSTAEGNEITLSENEAVLLNDNSGHRPAMTASSSIEDEEWTLENNDDLQQQEEYDEDEDGYQEEDEVREVDDENLAVNQEFGDLHLEEKASSQTMDNLVLGFDEGIEVELPNDDFDRKFRNEESSFGISDSSILFMREQVLSDGLQGDEQSCELVDGFPPVGAMVQETENTLQESIIKPTYDPYTSRTSDGTAHSTQPNLSPSVGKPSSAGLAPASTASSAPNEADTPVKLQFGLFTGPPLIPSPVPAIQIGSIQMPLHLHPPIGPSLSAHVHPSPVFQFGQLRYTSPISQGVLPIALPSMSFVQPNVQTPYDLNQGAGVPLAIQPVQDSSSQNANDDLPSLATNNQPGFASGASNDIHTNASLIMSSDQVRQSGDNTAHTQTVSGSNEKLKSEYVREADDMWPSNTITNRRIPSRGRVSGNQLQPLQTSVESISNERNSVGVKAEGAVIKGKRFTYAVRNSSMRSSFPVAENSSLEANGFQRRSRRTIQRTEFRVRENAERRTTGSISSSSLNVDDKPNYGRSSTNFVRSGSKRGTMSSKPGKQIADSEGSLSGKFILQDVVPGNLAGKEIEKDVSLRHQNPSESGGSNVERNISQEDVDAPLQSGVVRVFKQPGIEAPSDEDDFIEVRSKRQMLNDRREQREKEIKAKARPLRKPRVTRQITGASTNSKQVSGSLVRESSPNISLDFTTSEGRILAFKEASKPSVSQPLAPIGTPATKFESQADGRSQSSKPLPTSSVSVVSGGGKDPGPALMFENKNKVMDNVSSSLSSWDTPQFNQQVMSLTQTQLEEAMKAPRFDSSIGSSVVHSSSLTKPLLPSSSLLVKERSVSTSASPINSLLAGEKIQFGAVTSPPIFPSTSPPGSSRTEIQISHNLSVAEDKCDCFYKNDKQTDDSCVPLQDSEAEAEAAASAVAIAAIGSDDVMGNVVGSIAISDPKIFGSADIDCITTGMACDQQLVTQSRAEESLSVSLPADLSVETSPISLWPTLPSPQNSSNQLLSHFPGGRPRSHFPFYEMNPMLGGPIFAFGPSDESVGTQSQNQRSSSSTSGPLGAWQQCHSTVDSFYGPPTGYSGPFISPSGAIPGVRGSPRMVVYNHFAPVGQFGQVGLSFMGPTYIPSGKHPDWKHNSSSSAIGMAEGHVNNANVAAGQRNPPNMAAPIQHLASGSPLMPIASPLPMFDVSPYQSALDIPVQAHWSHVPAPLHSVPLSPPLQQSEGILPSRLGHASAVDQSLNVSRFPESRTSTPSASGPSFTVAAEVNAAQFPDELGLVDTSRSTTVGASTQNKVIQSSSAGATADASNMGNLPTDGSNNDEGHSSSGFKTRSSQQKNLSLQQTHSSGYNYRGGISQRNNAGNEWPNRRTGFHGRNPSFGSEKGYHASKMKQIYVAKQPTSGTSASG